MEVVKNTRPSFAARGLRPIRAWMSLLVLSIAAAGFVIRACVSLLVLSIAAEGFVIRANGGLLVLTVAAVGLSLIHI